MAKKRKRRVERISDETRMILEDLAKLAGTKITSVFEVVEVDITIEEVILLSGGKDPSPIVVDLRDQYLKEAENWKKGDKIAVTIAPAQSRFTPFLVWVFEGKIEKV